MDKSPMAMEIILGEAIFKTTNQSVGVGFIKRDNTLEDCKKNMEQSTLDLISMPVYSS